MLIPMRLLCVRARTPEALETTRDRRSDHWLELDSDRERVVQLNGTSLAPLGPWGKRSTRIPRYLLTSAG
jgi:hypothetical protein